MEPEAFPISVGEYVRVAPSQDHPGGDYICTGHCEGGTPILESAVIPDDTDFVIAED
jgi:hypothetical protein